MSISFFIFISVFPRATNIAATTASSSILSAVSVFDSAPIFRLKTGAGFRPRVSSALDGACHFYVQDALASYIVQREANGMAVLYWYHTSFIGVARRRYLSSDAKRHHVHSLLAHYFLGSWGGGRKKPFQYSRKQLLYMSLKKNRQTQAKHRCCRVLYRSRNSIICVHVVSFAELQHSTMIQSTNVKS